MVGVYLQSMALKNLSIKTNNKNFKIAGELAFWGVFIFITSLLSFLVAINIVGFIIPIALMVVGLLSGIISAIYLTIAFFKLKENQSTAIDDKAFDTPEPTKNA